MNTKLLSSGVPAVVDPFLVLRESLDAESWDWLSETMPNVAAGVSVAVDAKQSPADIRRFVAGQTGRIELSLRCEQAARHLLTQSR